MPGEFFKWLMWFFFFALFLRWSFFIHLEVIIWPLLEFSLNITKVSNERKTVLLGFLSFFNTLWLQAVPAHCVAPQWDSTNTGSYSDKELSAHRAEPYIYGQLWHKSAWFSKVSEYFFSLPLLLKMLLLLKHLLLSMVDIISYVCI